jgi:hypothetical protein
VLRAVDWRFQILYYSLVAESNLPSSSTVQYIATTVVPLQSFIDHLSAGGHCVRKYSQIVLVSIQRERKSIAQVRNARTVESILFQQE